jgi:hypothetical protein
LGKPCNEPVVITSNVRAEKCQECYKKERFKSFWVLRLTEYFII